ncbi:MULTISPECIES: hypothetical protein [Clostridium]|uniref:MEDS domain-containing protein n=1 Tax=Clostridium faecium TaxID=2762223 RepID=A0ABR8YML8_9CLOT|nr:MULTISPECIES: hypothetical protein [Clostridium]MBD8045454.1 hypothetical protein [Clostridium faecium]MDU1348884.1 hypothetical protein [Clostridium argentinense]
MSNVNKLGKNIAFYYYGDDHMIINIYNYIKGCIKDNVYVYLNIEDRLYNLLYNFLEDTEKLMVCNKTIDNITLNSDFEAIKEFLARYRDNKIESGFSDVRFVIDVKGIINSSGKVLFKELSNSLYDICLYNNMTVLMLYDFGNYMNNGKIIDKDIIKLSYINHSHRMFADDIIPIEEFMNNTNLA